MLQPDSKRAVLLNKGAAYGTIPPYSTTFLQALKVECESVEACETLLWVEGLACRPHLRQS